MYRVVEYLTLQSKIQRTTNLSKAEQVALKLCQLCDAKPNCPKDCSLALFHQRLLARQKKTADFFAERQDGNRPRRQAVQQWEKTGAGNATRQLQMAAITRDAKVVSVRPTRERDEIKVQSIAVVFLSSGKDGRTN